MTPVMQTQDALVELAQASARVDAAEQELEEARAALGRLMRQLRDGEVVTINQMEKTTGYSHAHVYNLMGPASEKPRSAVRRENRRTRRGDSA